MGRKNGILESQVQVLMGGGWYLDVVWRVSCGWTTKEVWC